jgi:hypothetical protein
MPGRRSFLIGCGCIVTAPVLAEIGLPLATGNPPRSLPADAVAQAEVAPPTTPAGLVLRIDGWESPAESEQSADGHAWIRINSSWKAAWR